MLFSPPFNVADRPFYFTTSKDCVSLRHAFLLLTGSARFKMTPFLLGGPVFLFFMARAMPSLTRCAEMASPFSETRSRPLFGPPEAYSLFASGVLPFFFFFFGYKRNSCFSLRTRSSSQPNVPSLLSRLSSLPGQADEPLFTLHPLF